MREERKLRVFVNMVLRRIFGPRRDEITGKWRRLHNEELNDLCSSPSIVRVIKSRRIWAGNVARIGEERGCIGSWWGNRSERDYWGDLGIDGWIILRWISRRWDVGIWTGLGWHCSHPTKQRPTTATYHIQQNQSSTPNAVTGPLFY